MSHIVTIKTEVRDPVAIRAACQRLHLEEPLFGEAILFNGAVATGWQVRLPEWKYPVVCDVATGKVHFDNFNGQWGKKEPLNQFLQGYAVEKTKLEARKKGQTITEQALSDGSIKLTLRLGGAF